MIQQRGEEDRQKKQVSRHGAEMEDVLVVLSVVADDDIAVTALPTRSISSFQVAVTERLGRLVASVGELFGVKADQDYCLHFKAGTCKAKEWRRRRLFISFADNLVVWMDDDKLLLDYPALVDPKQRQALHQVHFSVRPIPMTVRLPSGAARVRVCVGRFVCFGSPEFHTR